MKKLLLIIITLGITYNVNAKQPYNLKKAQEIIAAHNVASLAIIHEGKQLYFDPETKSYVPTVCWPVMSTLTSERLVPSRPVPASTETSSFTSL